MITFSTRTKEAIKTALAMTIAYGISLKMGWEKPHWAGFAVAMISLSTAGQSLNKGFMRMLGTVLGVAAAFSLVAMFPQQRWGFLTGVSVYIGFCTYMLTGKRYQYAWYVAAFVCLIIAASSSADAARTFEVGVARLQETGMGVLVYSLISVFLWKQSSADPLNKAARNLTTTQIDLFRSYCGLMNGKGIAPESRTLSMQYAALTRQFEQVLVSAEIDSYEVWEVRHQWRRFRDLSNTLGEELERWRQNLPEVRQLGIDRILPNLDDVADEVLARLAQIEAMVAGNMPDAQPRSITVALNTTAVRSMGSMDKAFVAVVKAQTDQIELLTLSLFNCVSAIRGMKRHSAAEFRSVEIGNRLHADPDRLQAVYRVVSTVLVAFLLWVFIDPPGHASFIQLAGTLAMAVAMIPQAAPISLAIPFALGSVATGLLYVFVMPKLEGFTQLGLMIFGYTFAVYFLFWQPRQALSKMGAIIPFLALTSIQNEQNYNFAQFANSSAMIMLSVFLVVAVFYLPPSRRPEKICLRLVNRFFRHCEFMISRLSLDWKKELGWRGRLEMSFYSNDLLELSPKLSMWGKQVDYRTFPEPGAGELAAMVNSLTILAHRIKMLMEARQLPQADLIVDELLEDFRAWRLAIQEIFHNWIRDEKAVTDSADLQARLESKLNQLETRINSLNRQNARDNLSEENRENFYRLLGCYRSLSEAVVAHARLSDNFSLEQWREEMF